MVKKSVWDDWTGLSHGVLSWWKRLSDDGYTVIIKRWVWLATILRQAVGFKQCLIGTKGSKLCEENMLHTVTPPDWSMLTYRKFRPYYPNVAAKWRFITTANIFPVFFYPVLVSTRVVFCCCSPLASRFRGALLLSSVKTSGYLRYRCLLLSS